ncbi:hypothetical protein QTP86_023960 [Hemibagrus guttatus]|nr:hypothetical protein QTP86_023960 [Hemibagrus guttatus]
MTEFWLYLLIPDATVELAGRSIHRQDRNKASGCHHYPHRKKKKNIDNLNDYRPIALTSIIMKCFERLVSQHIRDCLPPSFDHHQFAYRANRFTEDAVAITS